MAESPHRMHGVLKQKCSCWILYRFRDRLIAALERKRKKKKKEWFARIFCAQIGGPPPRNNLRPRHTGTTFEVAVTARCLVVHQFGQDFFQKQNKKAPSVQTSKIHEPIKWSFITPDLKIRTNQSCAEDARLVGILIPIHASPVKDNS
ncbi:hypothetical protein CEXT_274591 [Caerostris extrusa]|uniref:Uncharacterized protein n=1 Tax=Caerostris extrusa TaxID=172846 RepID=A0AAV4X5I9_CAEEX|nr:hypothetical protein CEXT_274591 [Caerostris extrusa]